MAKGKLTFDVNLSEDFHMSYLIFFTKENKIFKETCAIDFTQSAEQIRNFVRGLNPYPAAWCHLDLGGQHYENVKVFRVAKAASKEQRGHIILPCGDGYVDLLELQMPGKKRMDAKSLLNGLRIE